MGGEGYQQDADSGLMLLGARYYDPSVGRFISRDPVRYGGGDVNLYRYCGNSPVDHADPEGLKRKGLWDWVKEIGGSIVNVGKAVWKPVTTVAGAVTGIRLINDFIISHQEAEAIRQEVMRTEEWSPRSDDPDESRRKVLEVNQLHRLGPIRRTGELAGDALEQEWELVK